MDSKNFITCWSYFVLCLLVLYSLTGFGAIGIVSYTLIKKYYLKPFIDDLNLSVYISYIIPVSVELIALFGCKVIFKRNPISILLVAVFTTISILSEITMATIWYIQKRNLDSVVKVALDKKFLTGYKEDEWDVLQKQFKCCGINGMADYAFNRLKVPLSCCENNTCFNQGCLTPFVQEIGGDFILLAQAFLIIVLIQIAIIPATLFLYKRIKAENTRIKSPEEQSLYRRRQF